PPRAQQRPRLVLGLLEVLRPAAPRRDRDRGLPPVEPEEGGEGDEGVEVLAGAEGRALVPPYPHHDAARAADPDLAPQRVQGAEQLVGDLVADHADPGAG